MILLNTGNKSTAVWRVVADIVIKHFFPTTLFGYQHKIHKDCRELWPPHYYISISYDTITMARLAEKRKKGEETSGDERLPVPQRKTLRQRYVHFGANAPQSNLVLRRITFTALCKDVELSQYSYS